MKKPVLLTIGYEGKTFEEFIRCLKDHGVEVLIDVREIPISRKRGFSKSRLKEHLSGKGIRYFHFKQLGSPREDRRKLTKDRNYTRFFKRVSSYLSKQEETIKDIHDLAVSGKTVCLMCFERLANKCHRSIIAERIVAVETDGNGFRLMHI